MPLTTEVFVMVIYILCLPLCLMGFRAANVPGSLFFMLSYCGLVLSNIFTVVETFWLEDFFNFLEHSCLLFTGVSILIAVRSLIADSHDKQKNVSHQKAE